MARPSSKAVFIAVAVVCAAGVAAVIPWALTSRADLTTILPSSPSAPASSSSPPTSYSSRPMAADSSPPMSDSSKCALTQQAIAAVAGVPCTTLTELFDSFCAAFDRGVDPREIFRTGQESFGKKDAQALMAMATATTCPQYDDQVTYDAVGWHP